jgi:hypothetical protein
MLDRELTGVSDLKSMCFERMRILDMSHYWSTGTHSKYQGKLNVFRQFEVDFGVPFLRPLLSFARLLARILASCG